MSAAEARAIWDELVAGRWEIVEAFDRDGQRCLVVRRAEEPRLPVPLSARELDVLRLATMGHSNKRIAAELGVALSTVASHLSKAAAKLGARSRIALIKAFRRLA
jgi:DNA-binding NarL/FixJ family response regulator